MKEQEPDYRGFVRDLGVAVPNLFSEARALYENRAKSDDYTWGYVFSVSSVLSIMEASCAPSFVPYADVGLDGFQAEAIMGGRRIDRQAIASDETPHYSAFVTMLGYGIRDKVEIALMNYDVSTGHAKSRADEGIVAGLRHVFDLLRPLATKHGVLLNDLHIHSDPFRRLP